jgi:MOSC domain-containing protein
MQGSVAWITIAPVKSLALVHRDEVEVEQFGVRENRRFYLIDDDGRMINGKVVGPLVRVVPNYDEAVGHLALRFPDGSLVEGVVRTGAHVTTDISRREVGGRIVEGPWAAALSDLAGRSLRLVRAERPGDGSDRGLRGGVSLVGTASLGVLADAAGVERLDGRRFRMLFGVDGVSPHAEDGWIDRRLRIGDAVVRLRGNVGRCAVTTQDPDTGVPDLDTLHVLGEYRGEVETTEPLPFGVWGEVLTPGHVRLGDAVEPE